MFQRYDLEKLSWHAVVDYCPGLIRIMTAGLASAMKIF
jgi:hypothetical protein